MKLTFNRIASPVLAATLAAALAGCGGGSGTASGTSPSAPAAAASPGASTATKQEEVTLRVSYWAGSELTVNAHNQVVELFQKAYPHIKVQSEYYPGGEYNDKILVQAASGTLPDVIRTDYSQIQNYVAKGLLAPLDAYAADKTLDVEGINPVHIDVGRVSGKLYGINIGNNALVLYYDPDKLKAAGVGVPGPDYSWEQYEKDLEAVKSKLSLAGDSHYGQSQFEIWLRQHGAKLYNDAQDGLGYTDDNLFTEFYTKELNLQKKGLLSSIAVESEVKALEDGPFPKGQTSFGGLSYWSNSHSDVLNKQLGKQVGFAFFPGGAKGAYIKPSFFHGIYAKSKHPKEAAQFIQFYTYSIEAAKSLNGYFGFAYSPKVLAGLEGSLTENQKKVIEFLGQVEKYGSPIDPPAPAAGSEVSTALKNISSEIFYEKITPAEGAKRFRQEAAKILKK